MACDESIARLFKFCSHLFGRVAELSCRPLRRINLEIDYRDPSVGPQQLSQLAKVCVFSCVDAPYPPCGGTVLEAARFYSQSDTFSVRNDYFWIDSATLSEFHITAQQQAVPGISQEADLSWAWHSTGSLGTV